MKNPSALTAVLATLLVVFWSSGYVGATLSAEAASVDTVLAWRTLICAILLIIAAVARGEQLTRQQLGQQVVRGSLVQGVYLGGTFAAAAAGVPAAVSALVGALQPLLVAVLARPLLGASLTPRKLFGLGVGAAGVGVVVAGDLGGTAAWANALPVAAVAGLALGTVLEGRDRQPAPLLASFAVQTATAAALFTATAGVRGHLIPPPGGGFWLAVAWSVGLSSFGGYGAYLLLVRRNGPTFASTMLYLTPPTTAVWAWVMFGEVPGALALPGAAVTAVGLMIFATGRRVSGGRVPAPRSPRRSAAAPESRGRPGAAAPRPQPACRT